MRKRSILIIDGVSSEIGELANVFSEEYEVVWTQWTNDVIVRLKEQTEGYSAILFEHTEDSTKTEEVLLCLKDEGITEMIPLIVLMKNLSRDISYMVYSNGGADLVKIPFDLPVVGKRIQNTIELFHHKNELESIVKGQTKRMERQAKNIASLNMNLIMMLSTVVEFRSMESGEHISRVQAFTDILLRELVKNENLDMTEEEITMIASAAALHDVGKIAIPDHILLKPGRLTEAEFEVIKSHPEKGCEIIEKLCRLQSDIYFQACYDICMYHHERYDGGGYPKGIKGEEIPLSAQVVALADVYDALVSNRVYKKAYKLDQSYDMILNGDCGVFSPTVMNAFISCRDRFEEVANKCS